MEGKIRGLKVWENFTYRIKIEFLDTKTGKIDVYYVTKLDLDKNSFEYKSSSKVKKNKILKFKLEIAVCIMNSLALNGYNASIELTNFGTMYKAKEVINAISKYSWKEIQYEYWCVILKFQDSKYKPTKEEQEIIDAYEFYSKGNPATCLTSNKLCHSESYKRGFRSCYDRTKK